MNFLSVTDLTPDALRVVVDLGLTVKRDPASVAGTLSGKTIGLFFAKPSLRTWVSTDIAADQLGMHPLLLPGAQVGLGSREAPQDVGRVLDRYLDALGMRVFSHDDLVAVSANMEAPVINLLSDREHPCQALADLMTVAEHRPVEGAVIAYVGDGNNVAHSLMLAATMLGAEIRLASPPGYEPDPEIVTAARRFGTVVVTDDPTEAVDGADAVYTDVWASMGQESEAAERRRLFEPYRVDAELFARAADDAIFLHCLPAHRGEEVTDEVLDHPRSRVIDQAENRLHSFKAILLHLLR